MRPALCVALIPLTTLACTFGHASQKKHAPRTFAEKAQTPFSHTLEASRRLVVEYLDGSIEVTGTRGGHVTVTGTRIDMADTREKLAELAEEVKLTTEAKDGTAKVIVDGPWRSSHPRHRESWGQDRRATFDFKVQVPADAELVVSGVNGGTMTVRNVRGALKISNVNGDIQVEGAAGAARCTTVNGSVEATFQQAPTSPCTFTTVNGAVKLMAPSSLSADIRLSTVHGQMVTDFEVPAEPKETHGFRMPGVSRKVRLGQGGPLITCTTVNGDLILKKQ